MPAPPAARRPAIPTATPPNGSSPRRPISARSVIGGRDTYATEHAATAAEVGARKILRGNARVGVTVREFWNDWTTGTLWLRRSASNNRARTHKFVAEHGDVPLRAVGDKHVAAWLKGGRNRRDGACAARVLQRRGERARRSARRPQPVREARPARASRGRRDTQPPTQGEIARFIALADQLTPPSFAGYLDLAVYEGMRPGEIDALRWKKIDFQAGTIVGDEQ